MEGKLEFYKGTYFCILNRDPIETFDCRYIIKLQNTDPLEPVHAAPWDDLIIYQHRVKLYDKKTHIAYLDDRYPVLKESAVEWLNERVGPQNKKWAVHSPQFDEFGFIGSKREFNIFFRHKQDAMLFKLTWA